jgi:hypothetical protein
MPSSHGPERQLVLDWTEAMLWDDLPRPQRERAVALLDGLLRAAATRAAAAPDERCHE